MERRDFLRKACLGSVFSAAFLEACKTSSLSLYKTSATNDVVSIPLDTFVVGDAKVVRVSRYNYDIAVMKQPSGEYLALLLMCTHAGQALTKTGSGYLCPLHNSRFSATGEVLKAPADEPLRHLKTWVDELNVLVKLDPKYKS
jgi:Rieske Fe-S protein